MFDAFSLAPDGLLLDSLCRKCGRAFVLSLMVQAFQLLQDAELCMTRPGSFVGMSGSRCLVLAASMFTACLVQVRLFGALELRAVLQAEAEALEPASPGKCAAVDRIRWRKLTYRLGLATTSAPLDAPNAILSRPRVLSNTRVNQPLNK